MMTLPSIGWRRTFGELAIIVVGVTIAFALNNWKEQGDARRRSRTYLGTLATDLRADLEDLESKSAVKRQKILAAIALIHQLHGSPDAVNWQEISANMTAVITYLDISPNRTTFDVLVNSGDIEAVSNDRIKLAIFEYYTLHERSSGAVHDNNRLTVNSLNALWSVHGRYRSNPVYAPIYADRPDLTVPDRSLLERPADDPVFIENENLLLTRINLLERAVASQDELATAAQSLLASIQEEL